MYRINLSDADVGAGQRNSALFLRLSGRVVAADVVEPPVTGVPEPGTWALIMAGMGLTGGALRRRRAAAA